MAIIFNHFCKDKSAIINATDCVKRIENFPEVCTTTFSENIIKDYTTKNRSKTIAYLYSANGAIPVYEVEYADKKMGLFLSRVGAPACAAGLEEIIAMGAKKIIQFGCCGILNQALVGNKIIIPSSAVRDEGTSYHYFPASKEIQAERSSIDITTQCLKKHEIPYIIGKIWTTDAIYRETRAVVEERKTQGCIAVEMECSASLAVAKFRDVPILQFFYKADNLDADKWEPRDLTDYGKRCGSKYMGIALECGRGFL